MAELMMVEPRQASRTDLIEATKALKTDPGEAKKAPKPYPVEEERRYKAVLSQPPGINDAALRDYENALIGLGELFRDYKKQQELADLVRTSRQTLATFAKAKTAKL